MAHQAIPDDATLQSKRIDDAIFDGIAWVVFLCAFGLRVWNIGLGSPTVLKGFDEYYIVHSVNSLFLIEGNWYPRWQGGSLVMPDLPEYLTYFVAYAVYLVGLAVGSFHTISQFILEFQVGTLPVLLAISRLLSVVSGSLAVIAVYYIGRSIFNARVGLTAAAIVSVSEYHFVWSKIGMYDTHATLFTLLSFYYCFRILTKGARKDYILAGWLAGFATASKYSGVFAAVPIVAGHLLRASSTAQFFSIGRFGWSVGAAVVAFLVAVPYFPLRPDAVLDAFHLLMKSQNNFAVPFGVERFSLFFSKTLTPNLGVGFRESFVAGIILILVRRRREELLVLCLPLMFIVANFHTLPGGYVYMFQAIVPGAALVSALFIDIAVGFFSETVSSRWRTGPRWFDSWRMRNFLTLGLLVLLMISPVDGKIRYVNGLGGAPIGRVMLDWINAYLPSGSRIFTTAVRPDSKKFKVTSAGKQDITEDFYESILKNYDYILITSIAPGQKTWGRLGSDAVLVKEIAASAYHQPNFQKGPRLRLYAPFKRSLHPVIDFVHETGLETEEGQWRLPINGEVSAPLVVPQGACSISVTASLAPGAGMPIRVLVSLGTEVVGDVLVNSDEMQSFKFDFEAPAEPERITVQAMLRGPLLPAESDLREIREIRMDGKQIGEIHVYENGYASVSADPLLGKAFIQARAGEERTLIVEPMDADRLEAHISPCIDFYGVEILAADSRE